MRVFSFLFLPFIAVVVVLPVALLFFRSCRNAKRGRNLLLSVTVVVAGVAALVPNSGQRMHDARFAVELIDLLESASYFVFVFASTGAWMLVARGWQRAALLLLVPIALFQRLKGTLALFIWSIRGFAP